jgi:hypothetical protein
VKSISIFKLIFSRPIFLEVLKKKFKLCWYELGNGKMCEFQHRLNVFYEKSLDLDCKNGLSFALFWVSVVCIYPLDEGISDSVEDENTESPKQRKVPGKSPTNTTTNLVLFQIGFQTLLNLTKLTTIE